MRTMIMMLSIITTGWGCATTHTSMERALAYTAGGAAAGWGVGTYVDQQNDSPKKSSTGTKAMSALTGAMIAGIGSYFFVKDDQAEAISMAQRAKFEADQMRSAVRQGNYENNVVKSFEPTTAKIGESLPENFDFAGLREDGCYAREFTLGVGDEPFVPVSKNIIMPRLTYWVLVSKTRDDCVRGDKKAGYLDFELPGIGKALLDRAEAEAKKIKGNKK